MRKTMVLPLHDWEKREDGWFYCKLCRFWHLETDDLVHEALVLTSPCPVRTEQLSDVVRRASSSLRATKN